MIESIKVEELEKLNSVELVNYLLSLCIARTEISLQHDCNDDIIQNMKLCKNHVIDCLNNSKESERMLSKIRSAINEDEIIDGNILSWIKNTYDLIDVLKIENKKYKCCKTCSDSFYKTTGLYCRNKNQFVYDFDVFKCWK